MRQLKRKAEGDLCREESEAQKYQSQKEREHQQQEGQEQLHLLEKEIVKEQTKYLTQYYSTTLQQCSLNCVQCDKAHYRHESWLGYDHPPPTLQLCGECSAGLPCQKIRYCGH